ncbi:MAG: hypothetical protein ACXVRJ_06645, partial [Gaiellaceae bacterium]
RRHPGGLALEPDAPPSLPEVLEQLDRAVSLTGTQLPGRPPRRRPGFTSHRRCSRGSTSSA